MFEEGRPIFQQLAAWLEDGILRGDFAEDAPVPSINELAAFHRINPATANRAVAGLADDGVLVKRRGLGMYVAPGARVLLLRARQQEFADRYLRPMLVEADRIGIDRAGVIRLIEQEETP